MQIAHADNFAGPVTSPEFRGGGKQFRTLLRGREGTVGNYRMVHARQEGAAFAPRHRHNFDQLRYCVEGRVNYGPHCWIEPGEMAYFPEGVPYGPEDSDVARLAITVQFGGASGAGFLGEAAQIAAMEALKAIGDFDSGVFRRRGEPSPGVKRNQDAFEAIWEHAHGRRIEYPEPRYGGPLLIRPRNFQWVAKGAAGVFARQLACLTERNLDIAMLRLEPRACQRFAERGGDRLIFVTTGEGEIDGQGLRRHSAVAIEAGECAEIRASAAMELLVVGLPEFA